MPVESSPTPAGARQASNRMSRQFARTAATADFNAPKRAASNRPFMPIGVTYYRPGTGWAPQLWKKFDAGEFK